MTPPGSASAAVTAERPTPTGQARSAATDPKTAPARTLELRPGTRRRRRRVLLWAGVLLVVLALMAMMLGSQAPNDTPLHPDNPGDGGMQALARVLAANGVDVEVVEGAAALEAAEIEDRTTVAVVGTAQLNRAAGERVLAAGADAAQIVVLVSPDAGLAGVTGDPTDQGAPLPSADGVAAIAGVPSLSLTDTSAAGGPQRARGAECEDPLWRESDTLTQLGPGIRVGEQHEDVEAVTGCFPPSPGYNLGGAATWHLVTVAAGPDRPQVRVLGGAGPLTNAAIVEDGSANAAAGLRLLGQNPRLIWYIPSAADGLTEGTGTMADVLPRGFLPAAAILGLGVLALMFWRGRRLGRIVTENLPAVIRSTEATRARGMMYRRAKARDRAAAALQQATRTRLSSRLGLTRHTPLPELISTVAQRTGRGVDEVERLLTGHGAPAASQTPATRTPATQQTAGPDAAQHSPSTGESPHHRTQLTHRPEDLDDAGLVRLARDLRALDEGITLR